MRVGRGVVGFFGGLGVLRGVGVLIRLLLKAAPKFTMKVFFVSFSELRLLRKPFHESLPLEAFVIYIVFKSIQHVIVMYGSFNPLSHPPPPLP